LFAGAGILKYLLEGTTELDVEDSIDNGVEERVDVTQPDEETKQHRVQLALGVPCRVLVQRVPDADGVYDVYCEERQPTQEKYTYSTHI
jgi:hypothetical protein